MRMFEVALSPDALRSAWERVRENQGSPGLDGVTIEEFERGLPHGLDALREALLTDSYEAVPFRRALLPKPEGGERPIDIPTVADRIVQQALAAALTELFEPSFLDCSFAYRPGRSALAALKRVRRSIRTRCWVLHGDVEAFFERVDHQRLAELLRDKVTDDRLIRLVLKTLRAPVADGMKLLPRARGIPQGSPLSPVLANIYLHPFDSGMTAPGYDLVRYADDFVVLAGSEGECQEASARAQTLLAELGLTLNEDKVEIRHADDGFVFLGYHVDSTGVGPSRKALQAIAERLDAAARENRVLPLAQRLEVLERIAHGWCEYYGTGREVEPETPEACVALAGIASARGRASEARGHLERARARLAGGDGDAETAEEIEGALRRLAAQGVAPATETIGAAPPAEERDTLRRDPISAISRLRALLRENPDYADGYRDLAECYAALGQYGLAKSALERAVELEPGLADADRERMELLAADRETPPDVVLAPEEIDRFRALFSGREGVYARQWVDASGHRGFAPVRGDLTPRVIAAHLEGRETVGVYPIRKDNTVCFLAFDIDVKKKILLEAARDRERLARLALLTQEHAMEIVSVAEKLGLAAVVEDSGYKGRHCWIFFQEPVPAAGVRRLAKLVLAQAGPPPGGVHREIFPAQDRLRMGRLGSLIKLPLGIHRKTGRRCLFLDADGRPVPDQGDVIRSIRAVDRATIARAISFAEPRPPVAGENGDDLAPPTAQIRRLLEGCRIVQHLVEKVRDTRYLNHRERLTLLHTVGHLGDEGKAYLHRVIGKTINYSYDITEKHIRRMRENPISCPRIKEMLEDVTEGVECPCDFRLPRGAYPSPVLHAYGVPRRRPRSARTPGARSPAGEGRPAARAGPKPAAVSTAVAVEEDAESLKRRLTDAVREYLLAKEQRRTADAAVRAREKQIEQLFDAAGLDSVQTELGRLSRVRRETGTAWVLEL